MIFLNTAALTGGIKEEEEELVRNDVSIDWRSNLLETQYDPHL